MHPKKKTLRLNRETVRQLGRPELLQAQGGLQDITPACPSRNCLPPTTHSLFDSCKNTDCCLMVPGE